MSSYQSSFHFQHMPLPDLSKVSPPMRESECRQGKANQARYMSFPYDKCHVVLNIPGTTMHVVLRKDAKKIIQHD